jgi:hypothetical protein
MVLLLSGCKATRLLHLYDVAYCPDLHCNLVSFRILRQQGLWWDTKSNPTVLRRRNDANDAAVATRGGGGGVQPVASSLSPMAALPKVNSCGRTINVPLKYRQYKLYNSLIAIAPRKNLVMIAIGGVAITSFLWW